MNTGAEMVEVRRIRWGVVLVMVAGIIAGYVAIGYAFGRMVHALT